MKVDIVSNDDRYRVVKELLCRDGIDARICSPECVRGADYLLLSVTNELDGETLKKIFQKTNKETVVLCGNDKRIDTLFCGRIINYSCDEDFLQKNAYLTAEATVSFLHNLTSDTLRGKKIYVSGYGRIGSMLCKLLKAFNAEVFAYARRESVRKQIESDGISLAEIADFSKADMIINTVPSQIFSKQILEKIPDRTVIVELASSPYGFASMERVTLASGLPGKILSNAAAQAVYGTVRSVIFSTEKETL